jgi:hypothetical protein
MLAGIFIVADGSNLEFAFLPCAGTLELEGNGVTGPRSTQQGIDTMDMMPDCGYIIGTVPYT